MDCVTVDETTYFGNGITDPLTFKGPIQTSKKYSNGEVVTYTGKFVNGLKHGNGTLSSAKCITDYFFTSITGQWNKDVLHGNYTRTSTNAVVNWIVTGTAYNGVQKGDYHLKFHSNNRTVSYDINIDGTVTDLSEKTLFVRTYPRRNDHENLIHDWEFNNVRVHIRRLQTKGDYKKTIEMILSVKNNIIEEISLPDGTINKAVVSFNLPIFYPITTFTNHLIEMLGEDNFPIVYKYKDNVVCHQLKNNGTFYYPESKLPMFKGLLKNGEPAGEGAIYMEDGTIIKGIMKPKVGVTYPLTIDKMNIDAPLPIPFYYSNRRIRYDGQCIYSQTGETFQVGKLATINDLLNKEEEINKYLKLQSQLNPGVQAPLGVKRTRRNEPFSTGEVSSSSSSNTSSSSSSASAINMI